MCPNNTGINTDPQMKEISYILLQANYTILALVQTHKQAIFITISSLLMINHNCVGSNSLTLCFFHSIWLFTVLHFNDNHKYAGAVVNWSFAIHTLTHNLLHNPMWKKKEMSGVINNEYDNMFMQVKTKSWIYFFVNFRLNKMFMSIERGNPGHQTCQEMN